MAPQGMVDWTPGLIQLERKRELQRFEAKEGCKQGRRTSKETMRRVVPSSVCFTFSIPARGVCMWKGTMEPPEATAIFVCMMRVM